MSRARIHQEVHRNARINWMRAAVLGANDGIVSTASLIVGVAAAHATQENVLLTGTAGLVAGAMSMAAGEYVSVSSQADTEKADLDRERQELTEDPRHEHEELAKIYIGRGLDPDLAGRVADQLMAHDALGSHARDELGIIETQKARPLQAAMASAVSFSIGAALPLLTVLITNDQNRIPYLAGVSVVALAGSGALAARAGGANPWLGALRIAFWGALAMLITTGIGSLFGGGATVG